MTGRFYFDPHATGTAVFLGPTEARLMELAWRTKQLTVKKALLLLGEEHRGAYTTIMTVLARLAEKGLLKRTREGRNFVYEPALSKSEFLTSRVKVVRRCLKTNFAGIR